MTRPTVSPLADELYAELAPVAGGDNSRGWPLLIYCQALVAGIDGIDSIVRDTDERDGWEIVLDPDNCPPEALGWLAQFHGVRLKASVGITEQRSWVKSAAGLSRGSLEAIRASVRPYLTGLKRVDLYERVTSAYTLLAVTYTSETADAVMAEQAIRAAVPAGIVVTYLVRDGQSYQQVKSAKANYAAVTSAYSTYADMTHAI